MRSADDKVGDVLGTEALLGNAPPSVSTHQMLYEKQGMSFKDTLEWPFVMR